MAVLGIDPGSRRCGYGIVERTASGITRLESGVLISGNLPMAQRLARILEGLSELLRGRSIDAVAVESAYCGRSPRSALALGQARGVALAAVAQAGLPVFEYAPAEVKRAFTGNGRAEKAQMVRTARTLFGLQARLADEADALAVAVCHLAAVGIKSRIAAPATAPPGRRRGRMQPSVRRFDEAS